MTPRRSLFALAGAVLAGFASRSPATAEPMARYGDAAEALEANLAIRQLFARYVAAVIRRDGAAVQAFFAPGAWIRNFTNEAGRAVPGVAPLRASEIGGFVSRAYHPYRAGMWSHILHAGEVVEARGARAAYSAQVLYLNCYARGPDGAPLSRPDLLGEPHAGEVTPTNCGTWEADLVRIAGAWKIAELRITVDLPYVGAR